MVLGVIGLLGFLAYSKYISPEPLIRGSISQPLQHRLDTLAHFSMGSFFWSILFYMPLYYEVAQGFGPIESGVAMFPLTFTTAPAAVVVGIVISKTGNYRLSIVSLPLNPVALRAKTDCTSGLAGAS